MNLPIAPPPGAVKQPTLPKLRDVMGPGLINGVAAVPIMVMIMLMAWRRKVMGPFVVRPLLKTLGWLATAAIGMFATWGH